MGGGLGRAAGSRVLPRRSTRRCYPEPVGRRTGPESRRHLAHPRRSACAGDQPGQPARRDECLQPACGGAEQLPVDHSGVLVHNKNPDPSGANAPLRSSASTSTPGSVYVPRQNIPTGEVTMQELLADASRVPGSPGAYLRAQPGEAIRFSDLFQLTINHNGAEFMLSREVVRHGNQVNRRWRIYSGTPDQIPPPTFYNPNAAGGGTRIERIVGHTHPRPIPYDPIFMQPSGADLYYLNNIVGPWQHVYGPQSRPFGRIIWGVNPGETTIYGIGSTPGNAVPPPWLRRP
jgi:hypothetical protein